jgi:LacI family transcriptional regulator
MQTKSPTMDDVAKLAGVSKATVSAVLNETGPVRHSTRDRVLAAIEQTNYRPYRPPQRPGARRDLSIAILVKEIENPYYADIFSGARATLADTGYSLLAVSSEGDYETERRAVELLRAKEVDGLIVTPVFDEHADLSHLFELKRRNFPFVLLERIRGVPASIVDIDNVEASRRAVTYLIEQGHTRIVHFAGPPYSMHSAERIDGVRRAYSVSAQSFADADIVPTGPHLEDGYRTGLAFFRERNVADRPTAVTCYNDLVAIGLMRALTELGLRVPDDVSVVGYDDIPIAQYMPVPLTTVSVPRFRMGQIAAEILMRRIESHDAIPLEKVVLDAELVVRQSTRAVRSTAP